MLQPKLSLVPLVTDAIRAFELRTAPGRDYTIRILRLPVFRYLEVTTTAVRLTWSTFVDAATRARSADPFSAKWRS
jgi:hypothetical protein